MSRDDSPLLIPYPVHDAMVDHCRREAPRECCGLLAGPAPRVARLYALPNVARNSTTRYEADGVAVVEAFRDIRERGEELLAIYHSHPRWRAIPSRTDLATNYYGDLPRIIVSLLDPEPDVRVWRLFAHSYQELPWRLVPVVPGALSD